MTKTHCLTLAEDMTIYNALGLKQTLDKALSEHNCIDLDLSQVAQIDTAGLQLLMFAKREANRLNKEIRIVGHSKAVQDTIDFCNLTADFGDPVVITAREHH